MIVSAGKPDKDQRVDIKKTTTSISTGKPQKFGYYLMKTAYFRLH